MKQSILSIWSLGISGLLLPVALSAQTTGTAAAAAPAAPPKKPWSTQVSLTLKETFDSNVYLQDVEPTAANVAAAQAAGLDPVRPKQHSFVTKIAPQFGLNYKPCREFSMSASYAPELNYYHAESSEDHVDHRGRLNLGGQWGAASYTLNNTALYIDGNNLGPTFARPGDVPAIGGIPMRNRRAAFVFKNEFKVTYPIGDFFLRPIAGAYIHDFKTRQRVNPAPAAYVYENYVDRQDISGGLDGGYKVAENTALILGYRYGQQTQYKLNGVKSPYDNSYHRILLGVEGDPWEWLKLGILAGPDIRDFGSVPKLFDSNRMLYYIDAHATFLPSSHDSITLMNRRYEQPAFGGPSMYEDITYDITWKHTFDKHWATSAGFRAYAGDWQAPVNREDWIFTVGAGVSYTHNEHLGGDLAYSYDWVDSRVPNTKSREFTRHLVALSAKYTF